MKKFAYIFGTSLLMAFVFLFTGPQKAHAQLQTLTTINGWNAYVHLPDDYATTGTQKYPIIIFIPGAGEVGTNPAGLLANGPSHFIDLGNPMQFTVNGVLEKPIVISIQPPTGWPSPATVDTQLTTILNSYRVDTNRIYVTGLSMGGWSWDNYVTANTTYANKITAIMAMHAVVPDNPRTNFSWFANAGGKWWGIEGQNDYRAMGNDLAATEITAVMNNTIPGSGRYTQILYPNPGNTHCCWNTFYDPTWSDQGETIYTWMLKQRKNGTTTNNAPVANAGPDKTITLPTNATTITGTGTDVDGTIASYAWTQVSGPSTATITNGTTATATFSALVQGSYTFRLTVKDNLNATGTDDVVVTVAAQSGGTTPTGLTNRYTFDTANINWANTASEIQDTVGAFSADALNLSNTNSTTGKINQALTFNGSTQYVNIGQPSVSLTPTSNYTISLWVNPATANQTAALITRGQSTLAQREVQIYLASGAVTGVVGGAVNTANSVVIPTGQWTNIILVNNATTNTNTIYINGVQQGTPGTSGAAILPGVDLLVAARRGSTNADSAVFFNGSIDDVRIYNKALSTTEVSAIANLSDGISGGTTTNTPPVANAGVDQTLTLPTNSVTLTGTGTDSDGTIASYAWSKVSGGTATITTLTAATTTVTGLTQGTYTFRLTVTDNQGATGTDDVVVTVNNPTTTPMFVTFASNQNQTITNPPTSSVTVSGTISTASMIAPGQNIIASYAWSKVSGPTAGTITTPTGTFTTPVNQATATTTISGLTAGTYVFKLTATDIYQLTKSATVTITVTGNIAPIVDAGPDRFTLKAGGLVLTGTASDSDGSLSSYQWSGVSNTGITFTAPNSLQTIVSGGLTPGQNTVRLTVTDNQGATATDDVIITYETRTDAGVIVSAGADKTIALPVSQVKLSAAAGPTSLTSLSTQTNRYIKTYAWSKVSGGTATITTPTAATTTVTGLTQGTYTFRVTATDNYGNSGSDDVLVTVLSSSTNAYPTASATPPLWQMPTTAMNLVGTGADTDGIISKYQWQAIYGGGSTLSWPTATVAGASNSLVDPFGFTALYRFTVTDDKGATDSVDVPVVIGTTTVNAGVDQTYTSPVTSVTLTGKVWNYYGPTTYAWSKVSGGTATITSPTALTTTVTGLQAGPYTFRLTATDSLGTVVADDVVITNTTTAVNTPPTVNAGVDQTITLPTNAVTITGQTSDADGSVASVTLTKISGGAATIGIGVGTGQVGITNISFPVTGLAQGSYIFRMTATDNQGATATDDITVTVNAGVNNAPVANAGPDKTITLPTNATTITGTGTDVDGTIASYAWTQVSGPSTATITNGTTATATFSALVQGSYTFRLTVKDNLNATGTDDVVVTVNAQGTISGSIVKVGAGEYATSYVTDQGKVFTIYYNGSAYVPVDYGLSNIVDIDGAQYTDIVRNSAGNVWVIGLDRSTFLPFANQITTDATGAAFTGNSKVYGWYESYLTIRNGAVWMWGKDRLNINGGVDIAAPRQLGQPTGKTITKLVVMTVDTPAILALASDGTVWKYGYGSATPTQIAVTGARDIAGVGSAAFVVETATDLLAWSPNWRGDYVGLPQNTTTPTSIKAQWTAKGAVFPTKELVGNYNTLHIIDQNDNLFGAGENVMGEVGNGQEWPVWRTYMNGTTAAPYAWNFGSSQKIQSVVQIPGKFKNLQTSNTITFYFYAQDTGNNWYSWGRNKSRALGNGVTLSTNLESTYPNFRDIPAPKSVTPLTSTWTIISSFDPNAAQAPIANAGIDQFISVASTTLSGLASSQQDGSITAYTWSKVSGTGGVITSPSAATTTVTGLTNGSYVFRLAVTSSNGQTATDDVSVNVSGVTVGNVAPTANAGLDKTLTLPTNSVTLTGTGTDSDGTIASYAWSKVSGGTATITTLTAATTTVTGLTQGTYTFRLTVTDNQGATGTDDVVVTVNAQGTITNALQNRYTFDTANVSWSNTTSEIQDTVGVNPGDAVGMTSANSATGKINQALTFNGTSQYISIGQPAVSLTPTSSYSLSLWVNPSTTQTSSLIAKGQNTLAQREFQIYLASGVVTGVVGGAVNTGNSTALPLNQWSHIVLVNDASTNTNKLYINGVLAGTTAVSGTATLAGVDVLIGARRAVSNTDAGAYFNGLLDDVRIYNYALSATEISAIANLADGISGGTIGNNTPVANAGVDQTLTLPTNSVTLTGTGTDSDGTIASYAWSKVSGGTATITTPTAATTTVTGLTQGTYTFRLTVTDNQGATGTDDVVVTVNAQGTMQTGQKISITNTMLINEKIMGDETRLIDEPNSLVLDTNGNPVQTTTPASCGQWWNQPVGQRLCFRGDDSPTTPSTKPWPASVVIDLGRNYTITDVYVYAESTTTATTENSFKVRAGTPFAWSTTIGTLTNDGTQTFDQWKRIPGNNAFTRYLQLQFNKNFGVVREVVVYGTTTEAAPVVTTPASVAPRYTFDKFLGTNIAFGMGQSSDGRNYDTQFGTSRWFAGNNYIFNSSDAFINSGGMSSLEAASVDRMLNAGVNVFYTVQGAAPSMASPTVVSSGAYDTQKSIDYTACAGSTVINGIPTCDTISTLPTSYAHKAYLSKLMAQAYGGRANPMKYIELANEPDGNWHGAGYYGPYELAAMMSADYDGHCNSLTYNGQSVGVKNSGTGIKVVMPGLANYDTKYLRAMEFWFKNNRTCSPTFPADVINGHAYPTTLGAQGSGSTGVGLPPEDSAFNLKGKIQAAVAFRNEFAPTAEIVNSETGYDTYQQANPTPTDPYCGTAVYGNSFQYAPPVGPYDVKEVQGQWLARSMLLHAAAGVDWVNQFWLADQYNELTTCGTFNASGLLSFTTTANYKPTYVAKPSWYYIQTLRSRLAGMKFTSEKDVAVTGGTIRIQKYTNTTTPTKKAYVLWSPTATAFTYNNFNLTLDTPGQATTVELVTTNEQGSVVATTTGAVSSVTVNAKERPVIVLVDESAVAPTLAANAGPDKTISRINPVVTLDGSASTGNITSYNWQLLTPVSDGSYGHISNPNQAVVNAHTLPYRVGGYTFRLTVSDGVTTSTDDVVVNVDWTTPLPPQKGDKGGWHFVTSATLATDRANTNNLANVGDYIIDGANDGYVIGGKKTDIYLSQLLSPASYPGFTIGAGNKILIAPGIYDAVILEFGQDIVKGASGNPAIITSWGQLQAQSMRVKNIRYTKITGKYVPGVSGSAAYPGHANGYAFSQGKYGIYINNNWSSVVAAGLNIAGEYTNDVEVEYVEAGNGTFSPLTIKDPSATALDYNNILVHDNYLHDTGGEGTYQGQTTADPVHLINGLRFYNNRLVRLGNEGIQIGQQGTNNEIYNNVIVMPATRFKSAFQESQYFGVQLGYRNGGNKFYNNVVLGAGEQVVSVIQTAKTGYTSNGLSNDITNNALQFGKGFIGNYIGEQSALPGVVYNFNDNVIGNYKFKADKVFKATASNATNTQQVLRAGTTSQTVNMVGNIRDNSKTTMIANATTSNVSGTTVTDPLPTFKFNSGYGTGFDYTNYDMWGDVIYGTWGDEYANQTSLRQGEQMIFNQGDMVFWMGKTYTSNINNNVGHMPTGVTDAYWTKLTWTDGTTTYDYAPDDYRELATDYYRARNIGLIDTIAASGARLSTTPTASTAPTTTKTTTTTTTTKTTTSTTTAGTTTTGRITTTATTLNVRSAPVSGTIIGKVGAGTQGTVVSKKTVSGVLWYQVKFDSGLTGWVSSVYTKAI